MITLLAPFAAATHPYLFAAPPPAAAATTAKAPGRASPPKCPETSYFEIEQAMLNGGVHIACGRRCFNENAVDFLLTLHVNAGNSPRIRDGVDGPIAWPSKFFPTWLRQIARRLPHHDCRSTKGGTGQFIRRHGVAGFTKLS